MPKNENLKTVENGVQKKKVKNPQINFGQENVLPGDNARYLKHAMAIAQQPRVNVDSDEEVQERLNWYFNLCVENDIKPTVAGMANSLKIDRKTLYDWKRGKARGLTDNRTEIIGVYYGLLEELWEDYMMNGKVNPVSGIFIGKNHFDYTDKQEVVLEPKQQFDNTEDADDVRKRYIESTVDDIIEIEGTPAD